MRTSRSRRSPRRRPPTPRGGATPTPKPGDGSSGPGAISIRNALLRDGTAGHGRGHRHGRERPCSTRAAAARSSRTIRPRSRSTSPHPTRRCRPAPASASRARSDRRGVRRACAPTRSAWSGSRRPSVHAIRSAPTAALEWRLVRVSGSIAEVHRNGDRWTADLQVGAARVLIGGLAGSGIASTDLVEGRSASITGIVKRPYPTATDRRFAIVPRQRADLVLGRAAPAAAGSPRPGSTLAPGSTVQASGALGPDAASRGDRRPRPRTSTWSTWDAHGPARPGGRPRQGDRGGRRPAGRWNGRGPARARRRRRRARGHAAAGDALNATALPELRESPSSWSRPRTASSSWAISATRRTSEATAPTGDAAAVGEAVATLRRRCGRSRRRVSGSTRSRPGSARSCCWRSAPSGSRWPVATRPAAVPGPDRRPARGHRARRPRRPRRGPGSGPSNGPRAPRSGPEWAAELGGNVRGSA